jgi:hypothetical protein
MAETGTLQNLIIALLVVSSVAVLSMGFIGGISTNYNVTYNSSQYTVFDKIGEINSTISDMSGKLLTDESQPGVTDVISQMITSGYGVIKLFGQIPSVFGSLIQSGMAGIGVDSAVSGVVSGLVFALITVFIIFAAIALIMKVNA